MNRGFHTWILSLLWSEVGIKIHIFELIMHKIINVNHPIGSHPGVTTIGFFEHFLLCNFSNPHIVESSPLVVEPVFDKSVIMTRVSVSIMNANGMQVIGVFVHPCVCLLYQCLLLIQLPLHLLNLLIDLVRVFIDHANYHLHLIRFLSLHFSLMEW